MSAAVVERGTGEEPSELDQMVDASEQTPRKRRRGTEAVLKDFGLAIAPVLIIGLAVVTYVYYQSLDLANNLQQRSALEWSDKLVPQIQQHLSIAVLSSLLVIVVAIPLGILLTRPGVRRVAPVILSVTNAGQALPAYGLLVIGIGIFGKTGQSTAVYMLALFALLPVLRNTMVGLDAVDRNVIEAGRGMGLTKRQVLTKVELPLAVPVIISGIRITVILNIGMATLAFLIGAGGLGVTINSGIKLNENPVLLIGSLLVAIIALTFDWVGAMAERFLRPKGLA